MKRTVTLIAPLTLSDVRLRLRAALDKRERGPRAVGKVRDATARLRWKSVVNNPFRTEMSLIFEPKADREDGVILHGVSDIPDVGRFLLIGMTCMLTGFAVMAGMNAGPVSLLPWGLMIVGAAGIGAVYVVGREVARAEHDLLVGFLSRTLDARIVRTPSRFE